jgi:hypothetical protein
MIQQGWNAPSPHVEPCQRLFHKLKHTGKILAKWGRRLFSNTKVTMHAALLVFLHFDMAQEVRQLSVGELDIRAKLKKKVVALAVLREPARDNVPALPTSRREMPTRDFST